MYRQGRWYASHAICGIAGMRKHTRVTLTAVNVNAGGMVATPYRESYGEDEYARPENVNWSPSGHARETPWWDEEDYDPDDTEDYLAAAVRYFENRSKAGNAPAVWYDFAVRQWKCRCREFEDNGKCRHVHRYRPQETVNIVEGYL